MERRDRATDLILASVWLVALALCGAAAGASAEPAPRALPSIGHGPSRSAAALGPGSAGSLSAATVPAGARSAVADAATRAGRFQDHGIGAKVAEGRGIVTTRTLDGRYLVVACALDMSPTGYVLVTDVDSATTAQVYCPADVPHGAPYASMLASTGMFYTAQGPVLLELDPARLEWTFHGRPSPRGAAYLSFTEGLDGVVWAGAVYETTLVSFDPRTRQMMDHGRLDEAEQYLMHLATDDAGWVYGGIGTSRGNIVAYHPGTGEKRQLVPEADRVYETAVVYPAADGTAVGRAASRTYRLHGGQATPIDAGDAAPRRAVDNIYWGQRTGTFPDGRRVRAYDLPGRWLEVEEPRTGEVRRIELMYEAGGVGITSVAPGPGGMVYGSTAHPMHFLAVDSATGTLADYGHIPEIGGGNFCSMARQGDYMAGAQYSHGRLWLYDTAAPWDLEAGNPRWVAQWSRDICRPRAALAHPDGRHILISGFADYGLCGGGIGIYDLEAGSPSLLTADPDLLEGHSPIALAALPDGDIVAGTSVEAPGGGHPSATEAELFVLDWPSRRVVFRTVPVPGDRNVVCLVAVPGGLVLGLSANRTFFAFDAAARQVVHRESYAAYGAVPRHALQLAGDGQVYALMSERIVRIDPGSLQHEPLDPAPAPISAGGAFAGGRLWYASGARVWSYGVPAASTLHLPHVLALGG